MFDYFLFNTYVSTIILYFFLAKLIVQAISMFIDGIISILMLSVLVMHVIFALFGILHVLKALYVHIFVFIILLPFLVWAGDRLFQGSLLMPNFDAEIRVGGFLLSSLLPLILIPFSFINIDVSVQNIENLNLLLLILSITFSLTFIYINGTLLISKLKQRYLKDETQYSSKQKYFKNITTSQNNLWFKFGGLIHMMMCIEIYYILGYYENFITSAFIVTILYLLWSYFYLSKITTLIYVFVIFTCTAGLYLPSFYM